MTETILTLSEYDSDPSVETKERDEYRLRRAARAVVMDTDGSVALLHAKVRNYFKLPGGGIKDGETIEAALSRELMEEIGAAAVLERELGAVLEWIDSIKLKQISYCFSARLVGPRGNPAFTDKELADGFEVAWVPSIEEAIKRVSASRQSQDINVAFMTRRDTAVLQAAMRA